MSPATFTREAPCTKVHLWNALGGGRPTPVVVAQSIIGVNAPKYLLRKQYMRVVSHNQVDYYEVSAAGRKWLIDGVRRHLELHPSDSAQLTRPLPGAPTGTPSVPAAKPRIVVRRR